MTEQQYRERAKKLWEREGEIEFDHDAVVSMGDDIGAYVQAWVWVDAGTTDSDTDGCDECGEPFLAEEEVVGCPDGAEIHRRCFNAGDH